MPEPDESVTLRLPARPDCPARAREALRQLGDGLPADVLDAALLLASEVVTNSVRHAGGMVTVAIARKGPAVAVAVADGSPNVPNVLEGDPLDDSGRGLRLVDQLATAWGCKPAGTGKVIWFRVTPQPDRSV